MKSQRIRSGLYKVTTDKGIFFVEQRLSSPEYGSELLWFISADAFHGAWFDPCYRKADALNRIENYVS